MTESIFDHEEDELLEELLCGEFGEGIAKYINIEDMLRVDCAYHINSYLVPKKTRAILAMRIFDYYMRNQEFDELDWIIALKNVDTLYGGKADLSMYEIDQAAQIYRESGNYCLEDEELLQKYCTHS